MSLCFSISQLCSCVGLISFLAPCCSLLRPPPLTRILTRSAHCSESLLRLLILGSSMLALTPSSLSLANLPSRTATALSPWFKMIQQDLALRKLPTQQALLILFVLPRNLNLGEPSFQRHNCPAAPCQTPIVLTPPGQLEDG